MCVISFTILIQPLFNKSIVVFIFQVVQSYQMKYSNRIGTTDDNFSFLIIPRISCSTFTFAGPSTYETYCTLFMPYLLLSLALQASACLTSTAAATLRFTPLPLSTTPSFLTRLSSCNCSMRSMLARSTEREMSLTGYSPTPSSAQLFWGPLPCR